MQDTGTFCVLPILPNIFYCVWHIWPVFHLEFPGALSATVHSLKNSPVGLFWSMAKWSHWHKYIPSAFRLQLCRASHRKVLNLLTFSQAGSALETDRFCATTDTGPTSTHPDEVKTVQQYSTDHPKAHVRSEGSSNGSHTVLTCTGPGPIISQQTVQTSGLRVLAHIWREVFERVLWSDEKWLVL